jgi:hypothetical protein
MRGTLPQCAWRKSRITRSGYPVSRSRFELEICRIWSRSSTHSIETFGRRIYISALYSRGARFRHQPGKDLRHTRLWSSLFVVSTCPSWGWYAGVVFPDTPRLLPLSFLPTPWHSYTFTALHGFWSWCNAVTHFGSCFILSRVFW